MANVELIQQILGSAQLLPRGKSQFIQGSIFLFGSMLSLGDYLGSIFIGTNVNWSWRGSGCGSHYQPSRSLLN